jgi:bifunctional non-homologous end joining protein LigD
MRDQLSLLLEPELAPLPNLPDGLRPMLPRLIAEPFDSAAHIFEPAWGGTRALALIGPADRAGGGDVRIVDADGREMGAELPELAGMAVRIDARSAILDGELVAVDAAGRADPAELARRIAGKPGRPVAYLAFDLLHVDGRSLLTMPLHRRRDLLRRILHPGDEVLAVPAIAAEGRALHEAATAQGIAGVLARQRTSPYLPGTKSRLWRFVASAPPKTADSDVEESSNDAGEITTVEPTAPVVALISRLPLDFDE